MGRAGLAMGLASALAALPGQALAQIWEGPCAEAALRSGDLITSLHGSWSADISVDNGPCTYRGESIWTLDRIENGSLSGTRRLTIARARPAGCQAPVVNRMQIWPQVPNEGGRCRIRLVVTSDYGQGEPVEAEISRIDGDRLTMIVPQRPEPVVYRRRREQDVACLMNPDDIHYLLAVPQIARQGATLAIRPMRQPRGPVGADRVPPACTSGWSVSDPALASLDAAAGALRIAPTAPPGAVITVTYAVAGQPVETSLRVVGADTVVLTGTRGQIAIEGCANRGPVRELVFTGDGRFSVTFMPFESYKDYWGTYLFDAGTGRLSMRVEGGNNVPQGLDLEGTARLIEGNRLVLDGLHLGSRDGSAAPAGHPSCRYTFG